MVTAHEENKIIARFARAEGSYSNRVCRERTPRSMPPGSSQYTLVGFSSEVDWRPLRFVKPIPPNRICSACGLVCKRMAPLPCRHTLCEFCYEQSSEEGLRVCPLDGYECHDEDDVDWKDFPGDRLLKREVQCWNAEHGCTFVMAACELSRHFQLECGHHSVSCQKCSTAVLSSNVCAHLRSGCGTKSTSLQSEAVVPPQSKDKSAFVSISREALENEVVESRRLLDSLSVDAAMHGDRLSEVSQAVNTLRETLTQVLAAERQQTEKALTMLRRDIAVSNDEVRKCCATFGQAMNNLPGSIEALEKTLKGDLVKETKSTRDHLSQIASSIEADVKKNTLMTVERIGEFFGHSPFQVAATVFYVEGVEKLKKETLKKGCAEYQSEKGYLRGYCISPGVYLKKEGESVKLCSRMRLQKGCMDDFLQWPFPHKIGLSVVHPKNASKRAYVSEPNRSLEYFQKPTRLRNEPSYFPRSALDVNDLIAGGFIENDNILVKFEVHT